jgi:hypothetical protein
LTTQKLNDIRPVARQKDLVVERLDDEILVYDLETDRAHCLNRTIALVWRNCNGQNSASQLGKLLELELSCHAGEELAVLALRELARQNLLQNLLIEKDHLRSLAPVSRRTLVRTLGIGLAALPLITSIISPTPAEAATCLNSGASCSTSAECCSGTCNTGTGTCI